MTISVAVFIITFRQALQEKLSAVTFTFYRYIEISEINIISLHLTVIQVSFCTYTQFESSCDSRHDDTLIKIKAESFILFDSQDGLV